MTDTAADKTRLAELLANAFTSFCADMSGIFGINITAAMLPCIQNPGKEIKTLFETVAAFTQIHAEGVFNNDFQITIDRRGMFTLAGIVAMQPEQQILDSSKNGSVTDIEELHDAIIETGNLIITSWNHIFNEVLKSEVSLSSISTFIGNPLDESNKNLPDDMGFLYFPCEITVASYPVFKCGVLFSESVYQEMCDTLSEAVKTPSIDTKTDIEEDAQGTDNNISSENIEEIKDNHREPVGGGVSQAIQTMLHTFPDISLENIQQLYELRARDVMETSLLWGKPDDSVQQTFDKMQQTQIPCMLIGEPNSLEGIVARLDIAEAVSVYLRPVFSKWRRPADDASLQVRIKIIMSSPVHTISDESTFADILNAMYHYRIHYLPVTNEQGCIEGMVSAFGLFRLLLELVPQTEQVASGENVSSSE